MSVGNSTTFAIYMDLPLLDDFPDADDDPHLLPVGEDQGQGLFHGGREVDNSDLVQDCRWMFFIALSEDTCGTSWGGPPG